MHIYMYMYTHIFTYMYIFSRYLINIHMYTFMYIYTYIIYIHTYIRSPICYPLRNGATTYTYILHEVMESAHKLGDIYYRRSRKASQKQHSFHLMNESTWFLGALMILIVALTSRLSVISKLILDS